MVRRCEVRPVEQFATDLRGNQWYKNVVDRVSWKRIDATRKEGRLQCHEQVDSADYSQERSVGYEQDGRLHQRDVLKRKTELVLLYCCLLRT